MSNNPYDPMGLDHGAMTRGFRHPQDFRSHIDRLNGPWPAGPAVVPAIEIRENPLLAFAALLDDPAEAGKQVQAAIKKHRRRKKKEVVVEADAAVELEPIGPELKE